jgi:hypothetical protein
MLMYTYNPLLKYGMVISSSTVLPPGAGDMLKSIYDSDNDGIVDEAGDIAGVYPSAHYYGTSPTNPSKGFHPLPISNEPTDLNVGTHTSDSLAISSDGGIDDVVIPSATTLLSGLMSGSDKSKLDGIALGANMLKSTYDTNNDGIVDSASSINGTTQLINTMGQMGLMRRGSLLYRDLDL